VRYKSVLLLLLLSFSAHSWHKNTSVAYGEVGLKEYFHVLDTIFSPTYSLQNDLRKRLQDVYPEIKVSDFQSTEA
jgi:hypothetical protein